MPQQMTSLQDRFQDVHALAEDLLLLARPTCRCPPLFGAGLTALTGALETLPLTTEEMAWFTNHLAAAREYGALGEFGAGRFHLRQIAGKLVQLQQTWMQDSPRRLHSVRGQTVQ